MCVHLAYMAAWVCGVSGVNLGCSGAGWFGRGSVWSGEDGGVGVIWALGISDAGWKFNVCALLVLDLFQLTLWK